MMSTNLNQTTEDQLILYWVHLPEHTEEHLQGYIGVTNDFEKRMNSHRRKAPNKYFQHAIRKYGWDNLVKEVIVRGPEKDILELEQMFRPKEMIGWNLAIGGGKPPVLPSEVLSKRAKAWIVENPEAHVEAMRKAAEACRTDRARKANSERKKTWIANNPEAHAEQRRKAAAALRTEEYRQARSEATKTWIANNSAAHAEQRRKAAAALRTEEARKARSERMRAYYAENHEVREAVGENRRAYFADPENRKAQSERKKTYHAEHPEAGKEHSERLKNYYAEHPEAGKEHSERMKALPRKTCEHCGKSAAPGMFARWHGDKCKHKNKD